MITGEREENEQIAQSSVHYEGTYRQAVCSGVSPSSSRIDKSGLFSSIRYVTICNKCICGLNIEFGLQVTIMDTF